MTTDARQTVWHVELIDANGSANRIHHARGGVRSNVTDQAKDVNPDAAKRGIVDLGSATADEIARDRADYLAWRKGRRGRPPAPYVEFVVAGPPPYASDERWPDEKEAQWASGAVEWVKELWPQSLVVVASHHRDETAPHIHIVLSPRIDRNGKVNYGWCKARNEAAAIARSKLAKTDVRLRTKPLGRLNAGTVMSFLQSDCHHHVGKPYGLARGAIGSKARHQAVDQLQAAAGHIRERAQSLDAQQTKIEGQRQQTAEFVEIVIKREKRVSAIEAEQGTMAEREAELAAQARDVQASVDEIAKIRAQAVQHADGAARKERAAMRREEASARREQELARQQAQAAAKHRRALVALACCDKGVAADSLAAMEMWQAFAHRAIHGTADDLAEVADLFRPEPEPVEAPPVVQPQRRRSTTRQRRRRTRPNVVDFPGGRR